ncbi:MAG: FkbM family methyltransferase [Flavobacteriaceae bacterium]
MPNRIVKHLTSLLLFKHAHKPPKDQFPIVIYNDFIGKVVILDGFYEKKLMEVIFGSLNFDTRNYRCLDIGANIGNHSLQLKNIFKTVRSFEPQRRTFAILTLNTEHLENVEIHNFGLSNEENNVIFRIPRHNAGGASQTFSGQNFYEEPVKLKVYDQLFDDEISFIKIDVEGNELAALQGLKKNILKYKPVISFEYNSGNKEGLRKLLRELGYTTFYVPKRHFIESYIRTNKHLLLYIKLLVRVLTPPVKNKLVEIDLDESTRNYGLITTYHPDSKFKIDI